MLDLLPCTLVFATTTKIGPLEKLETLPKRSEIKHESALGLTNSVK